MIFKNKDVITDKTSPTDLVIRANLSKTDLILVPSKNKWSFNNADSMNL